MASLVLLSIVNTLFLPAAAGYRNGGTLNFAGSYGYYLSTSLFEDYPYLAWDFYFFSAYHGMSRGGCYYGQSVRAVREK